MRPSKILASLAILCCTSAASAGWPCQVAGPERPRITTEAQLPSTSFPLELPLGELLESKQALHELARAVSTDLDGVFARFEIADAGLERELYRAALHAAILSESWERATHFLSKARALEEREDMRRIAALHWEAWILTRAEAGEGVELDALRAAFEVHLRALADVQPWELVHRELERRASRVGLLGRGLLEQAMTSVLGDAASAGGVIEASSARELLPLVNGVRVLLPLKGEVERAYRAYLSANSRELADIWAERTISLAAQEGHSPVRVAVWDTGVDVELFRGQLWTNPGEERNGLDNDGNGFVDDLHGIAYGPDLQPTPELLYARHPDDRVWKRARSYNRGLSDASASIDSRHARRLQRKLSRLDEGEVAQFMSELMHYAVHSHGTHVAGIALEGNPFAELVVARVGIGHHDPGPRKSLAWAHRFAASCLDTVDYLVARDVRVVNMSWGWGVAEIEANLRDTRAPGSDADRSRRAREIHAVLAGGIEAALASAPSVLFVCGAGNSGDDSSRDRFVPSSLRLPNLITVGGVDRAGGATAFTSFGPHVSLYANGYQVESFVPGGERVPQSGTSMSSPQAANLAAKLLAIDPGLTPAQLIELMLEEADPIRFAGREVFLMNPRASVARAVREANAETGSE